jgi:hypothetical protein
LLAAAIMKDELGPETSEEDALSLSGIMNLDSAANATARDVDLDPAFACWSLDVAIRRLRPRYVLGVGLGGFLQDRELGWLRDTLSGYVGQDFVPARPPIHVPFEGYRAKRYVFRAWPLRCGGTNPQHFILLPQHPSRSPMTNSAVWDGAVRECVAFARDLCK